MQVRNDVHMNHTIEKSSYHDRESPVIVRNELKIGTLVAVLPGVLSPGVSAGTGWLGVSAP